MPALRFTAKCSPSQHRRLDEILDVSCEMCNALLESWKGTYVWWGGEHNPGAHQFPADRNFSRYYLFKMFIQVRKRGSPLVRVGLQGGPGCHMLFRPDYQVLLQALRREGNGLGVATPGIPGSISTTASEPDDGAAVPWPPPVPL